MNLLYEAPPDTVEVGGKAYPVYTDFRDWLRFFDMQEDSSIDKREKILLMLEWYKEKPPVDLLQESLEALILFASRKDAPPEDDREPGRKSTDKVLSWNFDAAYVYAAFLSVYHIDLLTIPEMHWHVFLALFDALPDDTPIKQRMGYRSVNLSAVKDKNERKRIKKIQDSIRIPREELDAYQCGEFFE
ncbi:bacteriophage Gp15 family protein [Ruminococcus sp.]|uniref:bacteriophage Gp15 family protein n=1 Tax=Ruminococcus sp. TaxID=41978 RepID=UPI0025DC4687|nr:bacteriophage Gp15 family protein [Ruminococcus sp.]